MADVNSTLKCLVGKTLFFFDICQQGNLLGAGRRALPNGIRGAVNVLARAEDGVVVISSSTGRHLGYDAAVWGNGVLTKAVVGGLWRVAAQTGNTYITHQMLGYFVSDRVKQLTGGKQAPVTQSRGSIPDFPVAVGRSRASEERPYGAVFILA